MYTDDYKKTIGVDFLEKVQYVPALGEDVRLFLWDTAGQEEFDSITKTYYRGGQACRMRRGFIPAADWPLRTANRWHRCCQCTARAVQPAECDRAPHTSIQLLVQYSVGSLLNHLSSHCSGAGAAVIAFSTTDRASFEAAAKWKAKVAAECGDIAMVLVQNKVDMLDKVRRTCREQFGCLFCCNGKCVVLSLQAPQNMAALPFDVTRQHAVSSQVCCDL